MNNFADQFALSSGVGISEVAAAIELASRRTILKESLGKATFELWDTADWRFHARNLRLEVRRSPGAEVGAEVVIATSGGYGQIGTLLNPPTQDHEHPTNIEPAGMALRVKTIIGDRALIKLAEIDALVERIWIVDEFEKRLGLFEIRSCSEPNLRWIIPRARTGYLLEFSSITDSLRQVFEPWISMPEGFDIWRFSLLAIGRKPFDYTSSFKVRLDPTASASKGIGSLLLYLQSCATKNLDGMINDLDPEFTHDFRVSIRRARSLIAASSSLLDESKATQLRSSLSQLANLAGQVRDLDVAMDSIETIEELNNDSTKVALKRLREEARNELLRLSKQGYITEVLEQWHRFATEAYLAQNPKEASIYQAAKSQLFEARSSMLKVSNKKRIESDHESLHNLRKKAKALRYLLEGYSSLLDPIRTTTAVSDLKGLQDYLGKLQDRATLLVLLRKLNIETIDPELFEIPAGVSKALASFKSKEADRHYKELLDAMIKRPNL